MMVIHKKKPKTCQCVLRTTPKVKKAQTLKSKKYIFNCHLKKETRYVITYYRNDDNNGCKFKKS